MRASWRQEDRIIINAVIFPAYCLSLHSSAFLYYRYIAVCHPLKASTICSRSHVIKVLPILLVVLLTLNSHFFFTVSLKMRTIADKTVYSCEAKDSFNYLVTHIWPWVDICTYSFVPFVVISILNSRIIYSVVKARRGRSRMQPGAVTSTKKPSPLLNGASRRNGTTTSSGGHHETSYRLTFMLLTISFTFLMTTLPVNIIHIYALFINPQSLSAVARYTLIKTIAHMLMYCNHSINFFLYCATGEKFRHQLKLLFCRRPGTPRIQYNIKLHSNGTTLHTAAGRSPNRSPNTNRRSNCNHTDNEQLTPTCEAKQQLLDKSEKIEMKRILDGDTKPRITTLAINNKSYSYA